MDGDSGIVIHVTSGASSDWSQALRNLSNLYRDESTSTPADEIRVVVNANAVQFLLASTPDAEQLTRMAAAGVELNACENSLERLGYDADDLAEGVVSIRSGVAEVVRLQRHGNAYLKLP